MRSLTRVLYMRRPMCELRTRHAPGSCSLLVRSPYRVANAARVGRRICAAASRRLQPLRHASVPLSFNALRALRLEAPLRAPAVSQLLA